MTKIETGIQTVEEPCSGSLENNKSKLEVSELSYDCVNSGLTVFWF